MQGKHFLWLLAMLLCAPALLPGQDGKPVLRENERGELIIVYPDGRWQFFHRYERGDGTLFDPGDNPLGQPREALDRYPVFTGNVVPFESAAPFTEEDARKIAYRKSQLARSAASIAAERYLEARRNLEALEQEMANFRPSKGSGEKLRQLEMRLKAARAAENQAGKESNQAQQELAHTDELIARGQFSQASRVAIADAQQTITARDRLSGNFYANLAWLDQKSGVEYGAPPGSPGPYTAAPGCQLAYDGQDEYTGMRRKDVQKQLLFTHTDERLRVFLKEKEYLRCEGFMTSLAGGYRYLTLEFTFAYPNAAEAYGFIEKGSYLVIKLLDGQAVYLQSGKMDQGSYDIQQELLTYRVNYPINSNVINTLRKGEVDSIRMYWSSGFEEYEVFILDFFINQLRCLEE